MTIAVDLGRKATKTNKDWADAQAEMSLHIAYTHCVVLICHSPFAEESKQIVPGECASLEVQMVRVNCRFPRLQC